MDVRLARIGRENFEEVIDLELEKDQEKNLPSNVYSIAEASLSPSVSSKGDFGRRQRGRLCDVPIW